MAAASAPTKAMKVRPARAFFFPAPVSGSRIISSVPAIDRMISGRKRRYSSAETGSALADTGKLLEQHAPFTRVEIRHRVGQAGRPPPRSPAAPPPPLRPPPPTP